MWVYVNCDDHQRVPSAGKCVWFLTLRGESCSGKFHEVISEGLNLCYIYDGQ